jgi:hypothetical protein
MGYGGYFLSVNDFIGLHSEFSLLDGIKPIIGVETYGSNGSNS